ncbi:tetratricopeptide repeat protein [Chitinophaga tropicalis]|uniref:Tetratricopeptide repeat protein n=1 Tax=Chitinophaga tropicalis TaxID=2683588 RepID=A0A7K1TYU1_9BACT|nr:tetratricopeptide repeat protein [Chitinophaga tropicalis]MVT07281.1 tetratricopeptide repeat protein [Chitinophaga tropicalis]
MRKLYLTYQILLAGALLCLCQESFAQEGNKYIRKGNELYKEKKFTDAEANYKKALEVNQQSVEGRYNLGNSLYEQKRYDDARTQYANTFKAANNRDTKADASYNIGNTFMEGKKWEESIKAYKEALKLNPSDEQARYNLAYAQAMLKKQQQGGGGKDNKDQKDKDKKDQKDQQKKDQDKNKQDQKNKDQQNKDQQNKDQQNKDKEQQDKPEPQPSKMNKQEAERLLQALGQEENKLQDKMKKAKGQAVPVEKDW